MMQRLLLGLVLVCIAAHAADLVVEDTFENIKNTPQEQMVLFYRSSEPESADVIKILKKVAKTIKKEKPRFGFKKCDGDLEVNHKDFKEAAFHKGTFIFTSTPSEGIVKYTGPVDAKSLAAHIRHKYLTYDAEDMLKFRDEDAFYERLDAQDPPKPIFVKFYEQWCEHCKRIKEPFAIAATHFKDRVDFMEVECSKDEDTTSFCTKNEVRSYPVLMLFTGEDKVQFKEEMRSIITFEKFFNEHIGGSSGGGSRSSDDDEEEVVTKKSSKKAKKTDDEEDAEISAKLNKKGDKSKKSEDDDSVDPKLANLGQFAKPKSTDGKSLEDRVAVLEETVKQLQDKLNKLSK
jgi:thiol-disulfide isomerase/thioredoxin